MLNGHFKLIFNGGREMIDEQFEVKTFLSDPLFFK